MSDEGEIEQKDSRELAEALDRIRQLDRELDQCYRNQRRLELAIKRLSSTEVDPIQNIKRLTETCGQFMEADFALYHHNEAGTVQCWAQWNVPEDYKQHLDPAGQLWHDLLLAAEDRIVVGTNLPESRYAKTDPNVVPSGLRTYVGRAVKFEGVCCGVLSIMYSTDRQLTDQNRELFNAFVSAVCTEERRRESSARLLHGDQEMGKILSASSLAISYFQDGKLMWTNRAMVELFRADNEIECLGKTPRDFYPSDDEYNRVREIVYKNLSLGMLAHADAKFRCLDGTEFDGHIMTGALDPANPRKGTVATISDISARKRAEEALRQGEQRYRRLYEESVRAEELYRSLLNSCVDAIIIYDMDGHATYVSDSFTRMFGWTRDEILGHRIPFVPESEVGVTMEQINRLLKGDIDRSAFETKRYTKDGSVLDVRISASRYHDHHGEPAGMLVIHTDITENKRAEQALARSEQQLRLLSGQLLAAQENERKRVAQELHDGIGQLLNTIKFRIDNVFDELQHSAPSQHLDSLRSTIPLIENAIDEVKRMSMDLRPSILDDLGILATVRWFLREFQATYNEIVLEKEIEIEEEDVPEPIKIVAFRVLQEALNNVAKHSKADRVQLNLQKTAGRLTLVIRDNGVGIERGTTFSPDRPTRGFGLASMRERTELSGGSFSIDSREGEGVAICASWDCEQGGSIGK